MIVYATTSLAYPKDHVFALRPTCILHVVIMSSIQNLLYCSLISYEHVTSSVMVSCDL